MFFCAFGAVAFVEASGLGVAEGRSGSALAAVVGARAGAELPLGRTLALRAFADFLYMIDPPTVTINGGPVYTFKSVSGDLGLAGLVRF